MLELGKHEIDKLPCGAVITKLLDIAIDTNKEIIDYNFGLV